jgi:hypothetical protein
VGSLNQAVVVVSVEENGMDLDVALRNGSWRHSYYCSVRLHVYNNTNDKVMESQTVRKFVGFVQNPVH